MAILYGGVSDEREVSLASGQNAYDALSDSGVDVELIDTRDGREALRHLADGNYAVAFIALHGFTTHLSPTACAISSTDMAVGLASVTDLATASPARAYMALERDLSIAVALAATPEPV